jgi:tetratricopeptide (TPR) repeat protein
MLVARKSLQLLALGAALAHWHGAWAVRAADGDRSDAAGAAKSTAAEPIASLIQQLGDDNYYARQRATEQLRELGHEAFDELAANEHHPDVEIASRVQYLLRLIAVPWVQPGDSPEVREALAEYGSGDDTRRLQHVRDLGTLADDPQVEALARIVRFDPSPLVARHAALQIIRQPVPPSTDWQARVEAVQRGIGPSRRQPVHWLQTYLAAQQGQWAAAAQQWAQHVERERETLASYPMQTSRDIQRWLLQVQAEVLSRLDRADDLRLVVQQIVALESGSVDSLVRLVNWLAEYRVWWAVDEVSRRFARTIDSDPILLYALAEANHRQGRTELADRYAADAKKLDEFNTIRHLQTAFNLRERGMLKWAEQEFRYVLQHAPQGNRETMLARILLSELLHDQQRDLEAAEILEAAVEQMSSGNADVRGLVRDLDSLSARMHYFYAEHFRDDPEKRLAHLEQAVAADATDADVLIALYRQENATAQQRQRTAQLIKAAADQFRERMRAAPDDPSPHNQFAWLVSNTEGDLEEALKASLRSLDLKPRTAAYLDTLGRCYYALGDLRNALKHQRLAVALEPHSRQMQQQLKLFEQALAQGASD